MINKKPNQWFMTRKRERLKLAVGSYNVESESHIHF